MIETDVIEEKKERAQKRAKKVGQILNLHNGAVQKWVNRERGRALEAWEIEEYVKALSKVITPSGLGGKLLAIKFLQSCYWLDREEATILYALITSNQ